VVLTGFGRPKNAFPNLLGHQNDGFQHGRTMKTTSGFPPYFCARDQPPTVWYPGPFGPFRVVLTPCFSQCRSCALLTCIWLSPAIGLLLGQLVLSRGFVEAYGEGEGCWRQALGRKNGKS